MIEIHPSVLATGETIPCILIGDDEKEPPVLNQDVE
jgi:hypothetical protein